MGDITNEVEDLLTFLVNRPAQLQQEMKRLSQTDEWQVQDVFGIEGSGDKLRAYIRRLGELENDKSDDSDGLNSKDTGMLYLQSLVQHDDIGVAEDDSEFSKFMHFYEKPALVSGLLETSLTFNEEFHNPIMFVPMTEALEGVRYMEIPIAYRHVLADDYRTMDTEMDFSTESKSSEWKAPAKIRHTQDWVRAQAKKLQERIMDKDFGLTTMEANQVIDFAAAGVQAKTPPKSTLSEESEDIIQNMKVKFDMSEEKQKSFIPKFENTILPTKLISDDFKPEKIKTISKENRFVTASGEQRSSAYVNFSEEVLPMGVQELDITNIGYEYASIFRQSTRQEIIDIVKRTWEDDDPSLYNIVLKAAAEMVPLNDLVMNDVPLFSGPADFGLAGIAAKAGPKIVGAVKGMASSAIEGAKTISSDPSKRNGVIKGVGKQVLRAGAATVGGVVANKAINTAVDTANKDVRT